MANIQYRRLGIAVIHKVPSKWIPIRDNGGKIVTAKIEERAAVDFIGRYMNIPIAFDAKSVLKDTRWYLRNVKQHQFDFLRDWESDISKSYILLGFWKTEDFFFLPFSYFLKKHNNYTKGGPASLKLGDLKKEFCPIRINEKDVILDYLQCR